MTEIPLSDVAKNAARNPYALHGGVGVDREYPLHRFYLYARQLELTLGGGTQQLRKLGRLIAQGAA